jgi:hypothetical protein
MIQTSVERSLAVCAARDDKQPRKLILPKCGEPDKSAGGMFRIFLLVLIPYALLLSVFLWRKAPVCRTGKPVSRGWGNRLRVLVIGATGGTGRQLVQ